MSTPDPNLRMSDTEREAIIERLHSAAEEGRLELDEFAERSRRVYEAKTFADVESPLTDFPRDSGALAVPNESGAGAEVPELTLNHSYTKVKRQGTWTVPARITAKPGYGQTTLDCRHAPFTSRDIELDLELAYSSLELILPKGASAVDDRMRPRLPL